MPTASEFRAIAQLIDEEAASLGEHGKTLSDVAATIPIRGGVLASMVQDALGSSELSVEQLAGRIRELAADCRKRADACDAYTAEVARWTAATTDHAALLTDAEPGADLGPAPTRPIPDAPWIEADLRSVLNVTTTEAEQR